MWTNKQEWWMYSHLKMEKEKKTFSNTTWEKNLEFPIQRYSSYILLNLSIVFTILVFIKS